MAEVRDVRKAKYELERAIAKQVLDFASDYSVQPQRPILRGLP